MKYNAKTQTVTVDDSDRKFMENCYDQLMDKSERTNGPKSLYRALQYAAAHSRSEDNDYARAAKALEDAQVLEISSDLQSVPNEMFSGDGTGKEQHFEKLILQEGVKEVGNETFSHVTCSEFDVADTVRQFGDRALYGFTCPSVSLTTDISFGKEAMACSHIDSVKLPDYMDAREGLLRESSVKHLDLGKADTLSKYMCQDCHELETVKIERTDMPRKYKTENTVQIPEGAFENCENLVDMDFSFVSSIGRNACRGCKKLDMSSQNLENMAYMETGALGGCMFSTGSITLSRENYSEAKAKSVIPSVTETPKRAGLFKKPLSINLTEKPPVENVTFVNLPYFSDEAYMKMAENGNDAKANVRLREQYGESYIENGCDNITDHEYGFISITVDGEEYHAYTDIVQNLTVSQTKPDSNGVSIMSLSVPGDTVFERGNGPSNQVAKRITAQELSDKLAPDDDLKNVENMLADEAGLLEGIGLDDLVFSEDDSSNKTERAEQPHSDAEKENEPDSNKNNHDTKVKQADETLHVKENKSEEKKKEDSPAD